MLTEAFVAATHQVRQPAAHLPAALKDVGIFLHTNTSPTTLKQGLKKSSAAPNSLAISSTHIFTAQADKAVVHVYNREKGNQEATVPFPERISCLTYAEKAAVLILGTVEGRLILWEVSTGRVTSTAASHTEPVCIVSVTPDGRSVLSGAQDASIHIWNLATILSFTKPQSNFGSSLPTNEPEATFSHHRGAISILATSYATTPSSTFVVSASSDKTLYIWSLSSLTVLRTILLPSLPVSIAIDPVDRAIYIGADTGNIFHIDLYGANLSYSSILTETNTHVSSTAALKPNDTWHLPTTSTAGAAQCLTLSYDGTTLLSGHSSGAVLSWDVAKHRVVGEVTNLSNQSVTNIFMLRPQGFANEELSGFEVPSVVKPRLDLSAEVEPTLLGIPITYSLNVRVTGHTEQREQHAEIEDIDAALTSNTMPETFLTSALSAIYSRNTTNNMPATSNGNKNTSNTQAAPNPSSLPDTDILKIDNLQSENARLKSQLELYEKAQASFEERRRAREAKREEIGSQKRQAFFEAKKGGQDGDVAMRPFMAREDEINDESENDGIDVKMQL